VTTNPDRNEIETVTFAQHSGHYTRKRGGFEETENGRPRVYVGKRAHGSYHGPCSAPECSDALPLLECRYYGDFRNPTASDWWDTIGNLVSLQGQSEPWMAADAIGGIFDLSGVDYTTQFWRWGPHISYCEFGGSVLGADVCIDWTHESACGTHPTTSNPGWDMPHCEDDGCDSSQGWLY
jgi:hypothetical protein